MRDYGKVSPQIWIGETGRALRGHQEAQIVALYLLTNPHANMTGLYYLPKMFISHETGLTAQGASKGLARAIEAGFCGYDEEAEVVWVREMARFQIAEELKSEDKRCLGVQNEYDSVPENKYLLEFFEKYSRPFHLTKCRGSSVPDESPLEGPPKPRAGTGTETGEVNTLSGKPDPISQCKELLQFLNDKTGRAYKPVPANLDLLKARLREGYTPTEIRQVIVKKCREWAADEKMAEYLRPATLFSRRNLAQYTGELVVPKEAHA